MSSRLLLPYITDAHEAAVRGLPADVADAMLDWASQLAADVAEMMAWGRSEFPDAFKQTTAKQLEALTSEAPQRAKRNRGRREAPRQDSGKARDPETPPRAAVSSQAILDDCPTAESNCKGLLASSSEPGHDHSGGVTKMVSSADQTASLTVTLTLPRRIVEDVAAALGEFHRRRTPRGLPAALPAMAEELHRLYGLWRTFTASERFEIPVSLPIEDWRGVKGDRMRRPGTIGLLHAAVTKRPGGWPSRLVTELGLMLWRALT